jgi:hypothetical protein
MRIDTLFRTDDRSGLVERELSKEQARELAVRDVALLFGGNKFLEDDLVLESLWFGASDEGLGPDGLKQYFGLSKVDKNNPSGKFTGEKPDNEMLLAQLVSIYDQWAGVKSRKEMDGLQGQLVVVPNDYIASRVLPLRNGTIQSKRVINDEMGPVGNHWIVIDEKTNAALSGKFDTNQSARMSTPGTVMGPNPIYNELENARVDNGGFGNYELQMVATSSLDAGQVHDYIGSDSASVRTVFATLFDNSAISKMAREKDGGIHRMVLSAHSGVEKLGVNIVGDTVKFSMWDIRGNDNRNKCIAAISANIQSRPSSGVTKNLGRLSTKGATTSYKQRRKDASSYEQSLRSEHTKRKAEEKKAFHTSRFGGPRGSVSPR